MNIFQSGEGIGKSGSFFFYTQDKKYVVKTTRRNEKAIVLGMLDEMVKHIESTNNESFLVRIYGIFTVKTSVFGAVDIILMQNTLSHHDSKKPFMMFDLKGSLVNRTVKFKGKEKQWWLKNIHN